MAAATPETETPPAVPTPRAARRRAVFMAVGAVWLVASVAVVIFAPRAVNDEVAMGQEPDPPPATTLAPGAAVEPLVPGFLPVGYELVSENRATDTKVAQRYAGPNGAVVITTSLGAFNAEGALSADADAVRTAVAGAVGVLTHPLNPSTGAVDSLLRWRFDADYSVVVHGIGAVGDEVVLEVAEGLVRP